MSVRCSGCSRKQRPLYQWSFHVSKREPKSKLHYVEFTRFWGLWKIQEKIEQSEGGWVWGEEAPGVVAIKYLTDFQLFYSSLCRTITDTLRKLCYLGVVIIYSIIWLISGFSFSFWFSFFNQIHEVVLHIIIITHLVYSSTQTYMHIL